MWGRVPECADKRESEGFASQRRKSLTDGMQLFCETSRKTVMTAARAPWMSNVREAAHGVAADGSFYAAVVVFFVVGFLYLASRPGFAVIDVATTFDAYTGIWLTNYGLLFPFLLWVTGYVRITLRLDRRRGLAYRAMFSRQRVGRFIAGSVLMMVGFLPFRVMFNAIKNAVPLENGFASEQFLANLDRALHFGVDPWRWLVGTFGNDWVLRFVELNYNTVWLAVCFGSVYWVAVSPRFDTIRLRYCLTSMISWIIAGNVLAMTLPSAGPIYYGAVTGDADRFAGLAEFVGSHAGQFVSAADYQAYLWALYAAQKPGLGSGISAFPSMHVSVVMLNALFIFEAIRKFALPAFGYVALIVFGSVYLGWHYAIDSYASILVTFAIYWGVKKAMAGRWRWPFSRTAAGTEGAAAS
jgi:hypothetical protein